MAGTRVYGVALQTINSIEPGMDPQLVVHKLGKLRRMFKKEYMVWAALDEYGKKEIVKEAVEANRGSLVSASRR